MRAPRTCLCPRASSASLWFYQVLGPRLFEVSSCAGPGAGGLPEMSLAKSAQEALKALASFRGFDRVLEKVLWAQPRLGMKGEDAPLWHLARFCRCVFCSA